MSDIELVIKIPEKVINRILEYKEMPYTDLVIEAIYHGVQLPKGHGRLIILSEDAVKREQTSFRFSYQDWISEVGLSNATVAIIEADKAESEE